MKKALHYAVLFFNDVCLWQMMTASPNDVCFANDVCSGAHNGKHYIIAERIVATSIYLYLVRTFKVRIFSFLCQFCIYFLFILC